MPDRARRQIAAWLVIGLLLAACSPSSSPTASQGASASPSASPVPSAGVGDVVPAPGSASEVYRPNPGAIVVAIDAGHGGCLDWGVPDPLKRGPAYAEKTMTLAIALKLRSLLEAQGITVVLTRQTDVALAGDYYPDLGCTGPPFRDVNGDGASGFDPGGKTRTRDELQSRIDLVNVARADILVSIHINSLTLPDGTPLPIAATQSYYTDETTWGLEAGQHLADLVQHGVVSALAPIAGYERQDRGVQAITYFIIAPPLYVTTAERPDPHTQPTRGILMPGTLSEVGSITLPAEQDLLASEKGQTTVAQGIESGLAAYFTDRPMAVRYDALVPGGTAATLPAPVEGLGPPFWIPTISRASLGAIPIRLTNTGTKAWPNGLSLLAGWGQTDQPYLRQPPDGLAPIGIDVPQLGPGESVELRLPTSPPSSSARSVLWVTLAGGDQAWTTFGSPPLQLAIEAP